MTYERSRPTYPPEVVSWLVEHLRLTSGASVAHVAAGTGKLTRLLVATGAELIAVEPVGGMREVFRSVLPDIPVVAGGERPKTCRSSGFAPAVAATFHHQQICTPDELVERFRAVSLVAVLPPEHQAMVLTDLRKLPATHPETRGHDQLRLPYRVDCYWRERLPADP